MDKKDQRESIPFQYKGNKIEVEHSIFAPSIKDAMVLFKDSVGRMLDVNRWQSITHSTLTSFKLTDSGGHEVDRPAAENDFFKFEIPEPESIAGEGFDWVRVELIKTKPNRVSMQVRPASSPLSTNGGTAHFFAREAINTFQVFRRGRIVTASVSGRNESPATRAPNVVDKVRNAAVAIGAIVTASRLQWESLVRGILGARTES